VIWVGWREQRTETIVAAGILVALALFLLPTGLHMASAYQDEGLSACVGTHPAPACGDAIGSFVLRFERMSNLIAWLTLLPGLIGVMLAAPFLFQFEHGTYRLDWTQSVTPRRWIGVKLGLAVAGALAASLALVVLITWWRSPLVHLQGRMDNTVFDAEGTVVFGYTLFALGLALALGVIWRRAVPAVLVAFGAYFAVRLFVEIWLRQRLTPPLETTWKFGSPDPAALRHAWVISEGPSDRAGHVLGQQHIGACLNASKGVKACLLEHGPNYVHAVYEPASRFWTMQAVETGLFGVTALALIGFAAWWARRQAA
jgi:hypothetical protein